MADIPVGKARKRAPLAERFWPKVLKGEDGECWEWQALKHKGYGMIGEGGRGRPLYAHRVSWEIANGPIPDGLWVLHTCDNPGCVNPAHLFLGDHGDNMADMAAKGRRSNIVTNAKLTPEQVDEIRKFGPIRDAERIASGRSRAAYPTLVEIGSAYGVSGSTVRAILTGITWRPL